MKQFFDRKKKKALFAGAIFAALVSVVLVAASRDGWLPEAPDKWAYDWRTVLFSDVAPDTRNDIAIVIVNEQSLSGYHYLSPVDREMLAKLVSEIDKVGPAAIGLDFIFDTPTEKAKDEQLIETLKNIKTPIVLGAIDVSQPTIPQRNRAFQQDFLTRTGQRAGHLYFATDRNRITIADQTVRYMVDEGDISMPLRSFATVLAEVDGPKKKPASNYISWLLPPRDQARPTFTILRVAPHKDEEGRVTGPMLPPSAFELLKGKRVLIGGEFSDRDRHLTPFSVQNDERMTGVLIHAEILAQLLDGRSVYTLKFWQEALVVAIVFAFGFVAAQRWALGADETWATVMAAIVIVVVGIAMFDLFDLLIPSATVALAWPFGLWFGNIYETILKWIGWVGAKAGIVSS